MAIKSLHTHARRRRRTGLTLAELIVSTVIIAIVLVSTLNSNTNAMSSFALARDNLSGAWMANTLMNELMATKLPNFDGAEEQEFAGYVSSDGQKTFATFLKEAYPDVYDRLSPEREAEFSEWTYTWTKEIVLINEKGEKRTNSSGEPPNYAELADGLTDEDVAEELENDPNYEDPRELADLPTAQVIRIRLVLSPPGASESAPADTEVGVDDGDTISDLYDPAPEEPDLNDEELAEQTYVRRKHIVLIRYIDTSGLKASLAEQAGTEEDNGAGPNR